MIFLTSQTISLFGSSLVQYALLWFVTLDTKSGIAFGPLAKLVRIESILIITGALVLVLVPVILWNKNLITAGKA